MTTGPGVAGRGAGGWLGRPVPRLEDDALLRGRGRFVDDLTVPGQLEVAFLRSPVARGRIRGIDAAVAREMPGVRAILTAADLRPLLTAEQLPLQFFSDTLPERITPFVLAVDQVRHVGEAVAVVVADSRALAEDAVGAILLDIDEATPVADCRAGLDPAAGLVAEGKTTNVLARFTLSYGEARAAVAAAPHRLALSLKQHRGAGHPIECRGLVAHPDPFSGVLTVTTSTQLAHEARGFLCKMLDLDEARLRVVAPDVGGGFGAKFLLYPEEVAVAAASLLLGRPLKWIEDRREHFLSAIQERDQYWDVEVGFDGEGRLLGATGRMIHDSGAYTPQGINLPYNAATAFPGPYVLPAYEMEVAVVETNRPPVIPVRGAGYPEGTFAMERALDAVADRLGLSRVEVRRRNLVPPEAIPYETPLRSRSGATIVYDSGDFPAILDEALDVADAAGFPDRRRAAAAEGRLLGLGVALGVKGTGRGPFESGLVRIGRTGRVMVSTGAMAMGQGLATVMAQIAAEAFDVDPAEVTVISGDTSAIPLGVGGFASRQTVTAGNAVHLAAQAVRRKAIEVAGAMLEVEPSDLDLRAGRVEVRGVPGHGLSLGRIADALAGSPGYKLPGGAAPGLEAGENFVTGALTYGMSAHVAELEVDPETGHVRLLRHSVANDSGRALNPTLVEGQIHGGVAHGIGNALFEWMGYDERAQPLTTTLADYLLPTVTEMPEMRVRLTDYPSPLNPLGVKGVGEAGTLPVAAAVASAVEDALRQAGIEVAVRDVPLSPQALVALIARSGTAPAS